MSEPFIGQIKNFAGNFAPRGWAFCEGQLLSVNQNQALFTILGTTYGGDGRTSFALPDLRGRVALHAGSGPGLTPRNLGARGGTQENVLSVAELPSHSHQMQASSAAASDKSPAGNLLAVSRRGDLYGNAAGPTTALANAAVASSGAGQSHANEMPFQCINYIIALEGIFPSRS